MILSNAIFKRLLGVKPETFEKMLSILQKKYAQNHKFGGRPTKAIGERQADDNPQIPA